MRVELLVRGGTLVRSDGLLEADLAVADGRIAALLAPDQRCSADELIDARGLHVLPGLVDSHVHFDDPGRTAWEGFETGSQAAAAGGVTTVLDMPLNSSPPTLSAEALAVKRAAVAGRSVVDYGFWGGVVAGNTAELPDLLEAGVVACKAFMCHSGLDEYPRADEGTLIEALRVLGPLGGILGLHAEAHEATSALAERLQAAGRRDPLAWAESRPPYTEAMAAASGVRLAEGLGGRLHFVHVSAAETVRLVDAARAAGVLATLETCPHYLALDERDLARLGPIAKCAPPLRSRDEVEALWRCLSEGLIDCVVSDHSPCTTEEKRLDSGDIWQAWGGIGGVQTSLPVMLTEGVHRRGLSLPELARLMAGNPARIFGLAQRKGALRPGLDADLVLNDLDAEWELERSMLLSRNRLNPFVGRRFRGRVGRTVVRGRTVFWDREIVAVAGSGLEVAPAGRPASDCRLLPPDK
jgi:allantoinase